VPNGFIAGKRDGTVPARALPCVVEGVGKSEVCSIFGNTSLVGDSGIVSLKGVE